MIPATLLDVCLAALAAAAALSAGLVYSEDSCSHGEGSRRTPNHAGQVRGQASEFLLPALSYWSTGSSAAAGVAILLTSYSAVYAKAWHPELWSTQELTVATGDVMLATVYAPNTLVARETFFTELLSWPFLPTRTPLAGDFNCVLNPLIDRLGQHVFSRPESLALATVLDAILLADARLIRDRAGEDDEDATIDLFTYWAGEIAYSGATSLLQSEEDFQTQRVTWFF